MLLVHALHEAWAKWQPSGVLFGRGMESGSQLHFSNERTTDTGTFLVKDAALVSVSLSWSGARHDRSPGCRARLQGDVSTPRGLGD